MLRTSTTIVVLAASAALMACGGDDKPANNPQASQCPPGQYFDGQYCQTQQAQNQQQPQQQPAATATTAAPPPLPVATATDGAPAQQADPTTAAAATQLLTPLAQQNTMPGAKPILPQALAGNFTQGQSLETTFQMNPGKCYTVVGAGLPTVQNLDISLVPTVAIPGLQAVMAADNTQGSTAVVGAKPNCFKYALPMGAPVKMIMTVSAGQGAAAAQVYEK